MANKKLQKALENLNKIVRVQEKKGISMSISFEGENGPEEIKL